MTTFTVTKAPVKVKKLDATGDRPQLHIWKFSVRNGEGREIEPEIVTRSTESPFSEGESVELELTQGPYGWKAKRPSRGGGRPMDPARENRIVRQHSQEMALRFCQIKATTGELPKNYTRDQLRELIDWFAEDAA